jgi:hypothetical protein
MKSPRADGFSVRGVKLYNQKRSFSETFRAAEYIAFCERKIYRTPSGIYRIFAQQKYIAAIRRHAANRYRIASSASASTPAPAPAHSAARRRPLSLARPDVLPVRGGGDSANRASPAARESRSCGSPAYSGFTNSRIFSKYLLSGCAISTTCLFTPFSMALYLRFLLF